MVVVFKNKVNQMDEGWKEKKRREEKQFAKKEEKMRMERKEQKEEKTIQLTDETTQKGFA